jgi:hypothetical protein
MRPRTAQVARPAAANAHLALLLQLLQHAPPEAPLHALADVEAACQVDDPAAAAGGRGSHERFTSASGPRAACTLHAVSCFIPLSIREVRVPVNGTASVTK